MVPPSSTSPASVLGLPRPLLVVVRADGDCRPVLATAIAAARAQRRPLLVAYAQPRQLIALDPVMSGWIEGLQAEQPHTCVEEVRAQLDDAEVPHELLTVRFRREGRVLPSNLAAKLLRLAHRRGAELFAAQGGRLSAPTSSPGREATPRKPAHADSSESDHLLAAATTPVVAAVIPDSLDAVHVVHEAVRLAREEGSGLHLLVPIAARPRAVDPSVRAAEDACVAAEVSAVAARVRPALERLGMSAEVSAVPYVSWTAVEGAARRSDALERAVSTLQPTALVVPPDLPLRRLSLPVVTVPHPTGDLVPVQAATH